MWVGSQFCECLGEWVEVPDWDLCIYTFIYIYTHIYIYIHTYLYLHSSICSIYISVKAGALQELTLKKFYISMSQCLPSFIGLQALGETAILPPQKKVISVPLNLPKVPWVSVPSMQRTLGEGECGGPPSHRTAHLDIFAFIPIFISFLRFARHGWHTKSTRCLLRCHTGGGMFK